MGDSEAQAASAAGMYRDEIVRAFGERAARFEQANTWYSTALAGLAPGQTWDNGALMTADSLYARYRNLRAYAANECMKATDTAAQRFDAAAGTATPFPEVEQSDLPAGPPEYPPPQTFTPPPATAPPSAPAALPGRPVALPPPTHAREKMPVALRALLAVSGAVLLVILGGYAINWGESSGSQSSSDASAAQVPGTITAAQKAAGYADVGNGVVARWANSSDSSTAKCPSYATSCFKVAIQTNLSCPRGVYIELQLVDSSGTVIGKANDITPAMTPGDSGVFPIAAATEAPRARFATVNCLS